MNTLAMRVFLLVGTMLVITAYTSKRNRMFETKLEFWGVFLGSLALLFIIPAVALPLNLGLTLVFAGLMGWLIGPGIQSMMMSFILKRSLKTKGYTAEALEKMSQEERDRLTAEVETEILKGTHESLATEWNNVVSLAIYSTAAITVIAAFIVFAFNFNFSFLGQALFIALLGLIVIGLLNVFWFKSPLLRLISAYIGAVIFSLYLLYDFDRLKNAAENFSWETAINISISIYLDIVNLFLDLLQILSDN